MKIDDKTIKNCMKSVLDSQTIIDSKDAKIVFSEKTGKYKIKKVTVLLVQSILLIVVPEKNLSLF